MKRFIAILTAVCVMLAATGCKKNTEPADDDITIISVKDTDDPEDPGVQLFDPNTAVLRDEPREDDLKDPSATDVDVDLTVLSSTMVYAEVFYMLNTPEKYRGKTVRMEGLHAVYKSGDAGTEYHTCIVKDATECCATGLEFRLEDGAEYPEGGQSIKVVGVFETYEEDGAQYATLTDARIE
jgi:hypothetical protein